MTPEIITVLHALHTIKLVFNLEFWDTGEGLMTRWMPDNNYTGYKKCFAWWPSGNTYG